MSIGLSYKHKSRYHYTQHMAVLHLDSPLKFVL